MTSQERAAWRFTEVVRTILTPIEIPRQSAHFYPAIFGPAAHTWFQFLQARVRLSTPMRTTFARVAADQLFFSPTHLLCFLSTMSYLEGASVKERLNSSYKTGLTMNWMVWPWVQLANFSLVPLEHRVLVVNIVALGWNCYLSYLNGQGSASSKKGD